MVTNGSSALRMHVASHDGALAQALGASGADIVGVQLGDERAAQEAGEDAGDVEPERQRRQDGRAAACCQGDFPERHIGRRRRQQSQLDREEQDEQDTDPEGRHAERQRAPAAENPVEPGALRQRARERHRHAEREADDGGRRRRAGASRGGARR